MTVLCASVKMPYFAFMKIIHTSDWHLGHQLYGFDRTDEFVSFFDRLEAVIGEELPDALLVSGDIFDVSMPSSAVARMFKDRLLRLARVADGMTVIVTSGNHDSASRIDIDRNLWKTGGIHVIGCVDRKEGAYDFSENIIRVADKGYVAAIPFVNRAFMPAVNGAERGERSFFRGVEEAMSHANPDGLPAVLMAHLAVSGCDMEGQNEAVVGGMDCMPADIFGDTFDYVALGHIHKPQWVKTGKSAYSGSPLAISFDEAFPHSVSVVEVEKGMPSESRRVVMEPLRKLVTFPDTAVDFKKALRMAAKIPDSDNCYLRLNVSQEDDLPYGCSEMASARLEGKQCRFCGIRFVKEKTETSGDNLGISFPEFTATSPAEIAWRYLRASGLTDAQVSTYADMIAEIEEEIRREDTL